MAPRLPKPIGDEFVPSEVTAGNAAGTIFIAPDGDILLLRRGSAEANYAGHWDLPGGGAEDHETPEAAAIREATEELGGMAPQGKRKLLDSRVTPNKKAFHTFVMPVGEKFVPNIDHEHTGYAWAPLHMLPQPTHPSILLTLTERLLENPTADALDESCGANLASWARDSMANDSGPTLALDRDSVRSIDKDGRLHVAITHISKANVCEYMGREIPGHEELRLDPNKKYKLYRDPEELKKGALTFNNLPLLAEHVPVSADDHQPSLVIGSTGTDAMFAHPYLDNSLVIWTRNGIEAVESDVKKELSSAYRYRADMTPGRTPDGEKFDGVMRDIVGNHVALVKEGRAGPDVVVGDSNEELIMAKAIILSRKGAFLAGITAGALLPQMAKDAKPIDLSPVFEGITHKNFKEKRPGIGDALKKLTTGHLAQDANLDTVLELLDKVGEKVDPAEDNTEANGGAPAKKPALDASEFLKGKLSADDYANYESMMSGTAEDESEEDKAKREKEEAEKKAADEAEAKEDDDKKKAEDKKAMDSAIKTAVTAAQEAERARAKATRDAERKVRPWVGELAIACDSAPDVFRAALGALGVANADKIHDSGLEAVLEAQPKPGARPSGAPRIAQDAAGAADFNKRFGGAADRIRSV